MDSEDVPIAQSADTPPTRNKFITAKSLQVVRLGGGFAIGGLILYLDLSPWVLIGSILAWFFVFFIVEVKMGWTEL